METNNSSTNTVLLVIILLVLVGVGVWWFTMRTSVPANPEEVPARNDAGLNIDVNMPEGEGDTNEAEPAQ